MSDHRRLQVNVPGPGIRRRRSGRVLARKWTRAILAARGGNDRGEREQHHHPPSPHTPAPSAAPPHPECEKYGHTVVQSQPTALKAKRPPEPKLRRGDHSEPVGRARILKPPGESFGSTQRSVPSIRNSHIRQSLRPALPAPPVGSSPSFRAVAYVCVVTSPNEVQPFPTASNPIQAGKTPLFSS